MVFLKVVLVGLASPRGLTVQCFPQEYFSPTPPFHFRCVGPYLWEPLLVPSQKEDRTIAPSLLSATGVTGSLNH